jgi:Tol biopolymer transport system component
MMFLVLATRVLSIFTITNNKLWFQMEDNAMKPSWKAITLVACFTVWFFLAGLSQAAQNFPSLLPNIYLPGVYNNFDSRIGQIAFIATDPSHLDQSFIYRINEDGSGLQHLTDNPSYLYFNWSPDGSKIAFNAYWGNDYNIYTMNADGTGLIQLTFTPGYDFSPSWSSDSAHIAFQSSRGGSPQIYAMDANGANVRQLSNVSDGSVGPIWAPVGNKIVFDNYGGESNEQEIYVVNSNGSGLLNLTNNAYYDGAEGWSPDGMKIIFLSNRDWDGEQYRYDLYSMNSDGSNVARLTTSGYVESAVWSPAGTKIIYSQVTGPMGFFIINSNGSGATEVQCQAASIDSFDFSWSPDASRIAFTPHSSTIETQGVYVAAVDNSACTHIFVTMLASRPQWRPMP